MPTLTSAQIYQLAVQAGFPPQDAVIMTAIALGESGGRTDALGDVKLQTSKWGPSVGVWQIRSLKTQRGTGGVRDQSANTNPFNNAKAAFALYQGRKKRGQRGFEDWTVFTKGIYKKHLAAAQAQAGAAVPPVGAGGKVTTVQGEPVVPLRLGLEDAARNLANATARAFGFDDPEPLYTTWLRVGQELKRIKEQSARVTNVAPLARQLDVVDQMFKGQFSTPSQSPQEVSDAGI